MTTEKIPTRLEQFEEWLANGSIVDSGQEQLTHAQRAIAAAFLSLPSRAGKSWLIDRLYRFDRRPKSSEAGK